MKKILVVNVNWVGDVIFSVPVFRALKKHYPAAHLACLAVPRVRAVLESCVYLDEIITYDERGRHRGFWGKLGLIRLLSRRKFDIAFLLHRSWTRACLIFWAGIPERVGYDAKNLGGLLTRRVPFREEAVHRSDIYLNVIESYGVPVGDRSYELSVSPEATRQVDEILARHGVSEDDPLILLNTGGNWDLKRWPAELFAVLIRRLSSVFTSKNVRIVIPGSPGDAAMAREISIRSGYPTIALAGKTGMKELIALMKRARLMISADSGPMHIASAVGTPVVALFGPTRPEITGPRGKGDHIVLQKDVGCNRSACYYLDCPDNVCMKSISVDDVMDALGMIKYFQKNADIPIIQHQ